MDVQEILNIAIAIVCTIGGWIMKTMWAAISSLSKKVGELEVLVAGDYVKTKKFDHFTDKIFDKLEAISNKLDSKVDK